MKFELNIYGADDVIEKTYGTNICPWSVFIQAAEMSETLKDKNAVEQIKAVGDILQSVFKGLTQDELSCADYQDVMNTFQQIVSGGQQIKGGKPKNA